MSERIAADSLVTLHYRIAGLDGDEFVATFDATPATLQLGNGELAPALERCLIGLAVGERRTFTLDSDQGFGARVPQLVQRIPRARLPQGKGKGQGQVLQPMTLLEFDAPNGARFAGLVRELDEETALVDFNHPLAGRSIRFEVEIIGIL